MLTQPFCPGTQLPNGLALGNCCNYHIYKPWQDTVIWLNPCLKPDLNILFKMQHNGCHKISFCLSAYLSINLFIFFLFLFLLYFLKAEVVSWFPLAESYLCLKQQTCVWPTQSSSFSKLLTVKEIRTCHTKIWTFGFSWRTRRFGSTGPSFVHDNNQ